MGEGNEGGMTKKEFLNNVAGGKIDIIEILLSILEEASPEYCVIGGLAVNAYVEPVVSLDIDIVIAAANTEAVVNKAMARGLLVEYFEHSINIRSDKSDLRIQFQTDKRYQEFISLADVKEVLGYGMRVARLEDVLQGKVWAYMDQDRRRSKRQKDLSDILRIIESFPDLGDRLPAKLREEIDAW